VPKHRLVATGSYDLGWGFSFSGKGEIASSTNLDAILGCPGATFPTTCNNGIGGSAFPIGVKIPNAIGYRDVDLSLAKKFDIWRDVKGVVRFDVLNVFNYTNYDPNAATWNYEGTYPNIVQPNYTANGPIVGFPRTLRLTGQLTW
jgi:hypothetical protein